MALPHQLYAVVSHVRPEAAPATLRPHRNIAQLRSEKNAELRAKRAIDRANAVLDRLEQRQADIARIITALQRRQKTLVQREEWIRARIIAELEATALTRADGFRSAVLITPSPAAVEIVDQQLVPPEYMRPPKPGKPVPDKVAIKASIESGKRVPGCKLLQGITLRRS